MHTMMVVLIAGIDEMYRMRQALLLFIMWELSPIFRSFLYSILSEVLMEAHKAPISFSGTLDGHCQMSNDSPDVKYYEIYSFLHFA